MKPLLFSALLCLLFITACSPPNGSTFLSGFNPKITLAQAGEPDGISYSQGPSSMTTCIDLFHGQTISNYWAYRFDGSSAQLVAQLDRLRAEVRSELSSNGCTIGGQSNWSGNSPGFSFEYKSGGAKGSFRVDGTSPRSGKQGIQIHAYEH